MLDNNLIVVLRVIFRYRTSGLQVCHGRKREAPSGVSVTRGTTVGTTTDGNGNYSLTVPKKED
jgi:hypothetical protein